MAERSGKIMGNVWISWQNVGNMLKKHRQNETDDGSFVLKRKWNYSRLPSSGSILILMTAIYILSVSKKVLHIISIPITMEWHATINPILHIINNNINNFIFDQFAVVSCFLLPTGGDLCLRRSCTSLSPESHASQSCLPVCCCCCCSGGFWDMCVWWEGGPFGATMCSSSEPAVFSLHTHNTVQVGKLAGCLSCMSMYSVCMQSGWCSAGCSIRPSTPPPLQ